MVEPIQIEDIRKAVQLQISLIPYQILLSFEIRKYYPGFKNLFFFKIII